LELEFASKRHPNIFTEGSVFAHHLLSHISVLLFMSVTTFQNNCVAQACVCAREDLDVHPAHMRCLRPSALCFFVSPFIAAMGTPLIKTTEHSSTLARFHE
jgi:hypothetical protein